MPERLPREAIPRRVAAELRDGDYVNLGVGLPMQIPAFVPPATRVMFHAENGVIGFGPRAPQGEENWDLFNAGFQPVTLRPGGSIVDSVESFAIVRGRHLDYAVLGGMQVSEAGDLANWRRPERPVGSVGGAADIALGARRVLVAMEHTTHDGDLRILRRCTYPLTAVRAIDSIFTDVAVLRIRPEGLVLEEKAPGWSVEDVQAITEPTLIVSEALRDIAV
jgi:3-oxoacid CoA-transferase B subunit